jgi:hypothetical protein
LLKDIFAQAKSGVTDNDITAAQTDVTNDMSGDVFWPNSGQVQN